jgi:hypothetical protein
MLAEGWDADNQTKVWFFVKIKYYAAEQKLILESQKSALSFGMQVNMD